jgi:hypothetical protein
MEHNNRLNRNIAQLKHVPGICTFVDLNRSIGKVVKFVGTAGIHFETMTCNEVVIPSNKQKVQNHRTGHAAATTLMAQNATNGGWDEHRTINCR